MIDRRFPSFGTNVYPSPSGNKREGQIGVTPLIRCIQCGFPNDTRITAWSQTGEGLSDPIEIETNVKDRDVQSGCSFCGSLKWRKSKPAPLPDDRQKPSSEWYRRRIRR